MSWLRIDDGFAQHPKIAALSDREFRIWLRLLCYCARYRTDGRVPPGAFDEIPGLTRAVAQRFAELRLLQGKGDKLTVHDWAKYNPKDPTGADRQRRHRDRHRDADRDDAVTVTAPRARARARSPVPSPEPSGVGEGDGEPPPFEAAAAPGSNGVPEDARQYVMSVLWQVPAEERDEDLRGRFPSLSDDLVVELLDLAADVERAELP